MHCALLCCAVLCTTAAVTAGLDRYSCRGTGALGLWEEPGATGRDVTAPRHGEDGEVYVWGLLVSL